MILQIITLLLLLAGFSIILLQLKKIMSNQADLIASATALSTAADGLSVKVDKLITSIDAAVTVLQNVNLPPEGEAAIAALKASAVTAAAHGDAVDAEVTKLDALLPTPAPAAPTS